MNEQQMNGQAVQVYSSRDLAAITEAEIDKQIATAKKWPRNEMAAVDKSTMLATHNVKIAKSCLYFRPVGKKEGMQQFASGPSIRLAEIMKATWGNLRIAKRVIGTRDGQVGVEWGVHDLESNVMERGEVWRPYFGHEKMIPVITAAAMKFAERDAVFSAVPKVYADQVITECKDRIAGDEANQKKLLKTLVASFKEMGVSEDKLFSVIDRREYPKGSADELVFLIGLHNAIKDGLCSVEEVFGNGKQSSKPAVKKTVPKNQKKTEPKQELQKDKPKQEQEPAPDAPRERVPGEDDIDPSLFSNQGQK